MDIQLDLSGSKWIGYPIRSIVIPSIDSSSGTASLGAGIPITVAPLYKNIGHKNKLVWKNIFPRRENFVSDLRIISFPRGIIDLFL